MQRALQRLRPFRPLIHLVRSSVIESSWDEHDLLRIFLKMFVWYDCCARRVRHLFSLFSPCVHSDLIDGVCAECHFSSQEASPFLNVYPFSCCTDCCCSAYSNMFYLSTLATTVYIARIAVTNPTLWSYLLSVFYVVGPSEILLSDYDFVDQDIRTLITRLKKGELLLSHPIFRQPIKVIFPKPIYQRTRVRYVSAG